MQTFLVDRSYEGMRLDIFLVERLLVYSREFIQLQIQKNNVLLNDKRVKAHTKLRFKDRITVEITEEQKHQPRPQREDRPLKEERVFGEPRIVAETSTYFIIDKPAGWLMHEAPGVHSAPLISKFILEKDPLVSMVGDDPRIRPGIVHRLDKDVSGLIVIARTQSFFDHIKNQFINRDVKKTYQALVFGHPSKDEDDIRFRIARSRRSARMAAIPVDHADGKTATTHFDVVERFQHSTLLKIWVETGRTNQIRVHLGAYNLPIVGDTLYGKRAPANEALGRVMLHADTLSFFEMNGSRVSFESPLPPEFEQLLEKARSNMPGRKNA